MVALPGLTPDQPEWAEITLSDGARLRFECAYPIDACSKSIWDVVCGFHSMQFNDMAGCLRMRIGGRARVPHGFYVTLFDPEGRAVKTW